MKIIKSKITLLVLTIALTLVVSVSSNNISAASIKDTFPDANLAQAIASAGKMNINDEFVGSSIQSTSKLDIRSKNIADLTGIGQFVNLEQLILYSNKIDSLPDEIHNLQSLQVLSLGYNNLSSVNPEIGQLANLTSLDLSDNNLSDLPFELSYLGSIEYLYLNNNNFTTLPDIFGPLAHMKGINISYNKLSSLPSSFSSLSALSNFRATHNEFTSIPDAVANYSMMINFSMNNNKITSIPEYLINNHTNLLHIELGYNSISDIPNNIDNLTSLQTLSLIANNISKLPDTIGNLANLKTLNLSKNQLVSVPNSIGNLSEIQAIYLNFNHLTSLPDSIINVGSNVVLANKERHNFSNNNIIHLTQAQKDWFNMLAGKSSTLLYLDQEYDATLDDAIVNQDFEFDAYSTYAIELADPNYSVEYTLNDLTKASKAVNLSLNNGILKLDKSYLTNKGDYTLVTTIKNASDQIVYKYTYNFKVVDSKATSPSPSIPNQTIDSSNNVTSTYVPNTGSNLLVFASLLVMVSSLAVFALRKQKNN